MSKIDKVAWKMLKIIRWILVGMFVTIGIAEFSSGAIVSGLASLVVATLVAPLHILTKVEEPKLKKRRLLKLAICMVAVIVTISTGASSEQSTNAQKTAIERSDKTNATKDNDAKAKDSGNNKTDTAAETKKDNEAGKAENTTPAASAPVISLSDIPAYSGNPYVEINGNVPYFTDAEMTTEAFERYSALDGLGRCGTAYANVCKDVMPTAPRGPIGSVKPSGWQSVKYDNVDGKYLFNRCHLIGYQLSGENANEKNLITGTRYLNVDGMLPFENMVADHVKEMNDHVLYRVTPIFDGNNLVANGVLMEAKSVEDNGAGIQFAVYCYNVQPGISINYADGSSSQDGSSASTGNKPATPKKVAKDNNASAADPSPAPSAPASNASGPFIGSKNSDVYHVANGCTGSRRIKDSNKVTYATEAEAQAAGRKRCEAKGCFR